MQPTSFSNPLEKWVFSKSKDSVFFINFVPREDSLREIRDIVEDLDTVPKKLKEERITKGRCSTGFVVSEKPKELKILTSAHSLDHLITKKKPKSADELNKLYHVYVLCDHSEESFRQDRSVNKKRRYSQGRIAEIDSAKDLILVIITSVSGPKGRACKYSHPALTPSRITLKPMEKVVMVSWPPYRPRTVAGGEVSNCCRDYADVGGGSNPIGYDMTLIEVNIPSDKGGSGSPLLDSAADFTGVLHGGADGCSWFISLSNVCEALTAWGVLGARQI